MDVYEKLGVHKVINCMGEVTIIGGTRVDPRVMEAMTEASKSFCHMTELNDRVGERVAEITGAEAGMVTSGSAASMMIAGAACIMKGTDLEKINIHYGMENYPYEYDEWQRLMWKLPDTEGLKNEFITQKCHANPYVNNFSLTGGKLIWVGNDEKCTLDDIEKAINKKTAAIVHLYTYDLAQPRRGIPIEDVVKVAHKNGVPVILDIASECPPRSNIWKFPKMGVDLTCVSGGKGIKGPNDTGLLFGRKDLIYLARLQFSPHRGIGRPCKVDRTSIIGLLTALELYIKQDEEAEFKQWDEKVNRLINAFKGTPNVKKIERVIQHSSPNVKLTIDEIKLGLTAKEVRQKLMKGNPRILCGPQNWNTKDEIFICVRELANSEEHFVVNKLKEVLTN